MICKLFLMICNVFKDVFLCLILAALGNLEHLQELPDEP